MPDLIRAWNTPFAPRAADAVAKAIAALGELQSGGAGQDLEGASEDRSAGRIRQEQNWIGRWGLRPRDASFVPPPEDRVRGLLEDLVEFINLDGRVVSEGGLELQRYVFGSY